MKSFTGLSGLLVVCIALALSFHTAHAGALPFETIGVTMSGMDVKSVVCSSGATVRGNDADRDGTWECAMPGIRNGDQVSMRIVGKATSETVCASAENMAVNTGGICRAKRARIRSKTISDGGCSIKCDNFTSRVIGDKVVVRLIGIYSGGTAPAAGDMVLTFINDVAPEDNTQVAVYQRFEGTYSGAPDPAPSQTIVTLTNDTLPARNTKVAVLQKNEAGPGNEAVVWELIPKMPRGDMHVISYTMDLQVAAYEEDGTLIGGPFAAFPGQAWQVDNGPIFALSGAAANAREIEIRNNLDAGNIDAHVYRGNKLVGYAGNVPPQDLLAIPPEDGTAYFEFRTRLYFAPVDDSVVEGDILDLTSLNTFIVDITGARYMDLLLTQPDPSQPHVISLIPYPPENANEAVAWDVIPKMQRGGEYNVLFPQSFYVVATDNAGNASDQQLVSAGQAWQVVAGASGPEWSSPHGNAASLHDVEITYTSAKEYIHIGVYYDGRLFFYSDELFPGQKVTFTPERKITFVPVDDTVAIGDFLDVDTVTPISAQFSLNTVESADITMTSPMDGLYDFALSNVAP